MKAKDVLLIVLVALALYVLWPFLEGLRADLAARPAAGPELRMAAPVLVEVQPVATSTPAPPVIVTVVMEVTRLLPAPPATATATAVQPTAVQVQPTATPGAYFDAACAAASAANRRAPARCSSNYATPTPAGEGR